ncbi:MAG: ribose 5-phosphate isomerase B, partial [Alphaproteobacteria bacterium]
MDRLVIAVAADHAGFELKEFLKQTLLASGHDVLDLGTDSDASVDYPDFGYAVAAAVTDGRARFGVAVCGSGIGISIAANRHEGVRAALCHDVTSARLSREHNDANVLAFGARLIGRQVAQDSLHAFLETEFLGGRHAR